MYIQTHPWLLLLVPMIGSIQTNTRDRYFLLCLVIQRDNLAILHTRDTGFLHLLVLTLVVGDDAAQVSGRANRDVVRRSAVEDDPAEGMLSANRGGWEEKKLGHDILRLLQFIDSSGSLGVEQVTVRGSFLHNSSTDSVSLLKDLLRWGPLLDEVGNP